MKHARKVLLVALTTVLIPMIALAQSQTRPGANAATYNTQLQIGSVPGLTTAWYPAPTETAVPLGTTIKFKAKGRRAGTVEWTGAREIGRRGTSTAECHLDTPGPHAVTMEYIDNDGERRQESSHLNVIDTSVFPVTLSSPRLWVNPVLLEESTSNETMMRYFFGDSIAAVQQLGEGRYRTSTKRWFQLEVNVEPSAFAPLVEWRLNGEAQRHLGTSIDMQVFPPRIHTIEVGPTENPREITLEAYMVHITDHTAQLDEIPEYTSVTFTAVTDPPGYENEITWLASTKYGECHPPMGEGPEFTTRFAGTYGPDGRWLGVRADNAILGEDGKQGCSSDQLCHFMGLEHAALGDATLAIEDGALIATDFGTSGADGVAINLGGSSQSWRGELVLGLPASGDTPIPGSSVTQTAVNLDGEGFSVLNSTVLEDGQIGFSAVFRSSTYRLEVTNAGEVVFTAPTFPSGPLSPVHIEFPCEFFFDNCGIHAITVFRVNGMGECEWDQRFMNPAEILISGISIEGDRFRLIENLDPDVVYVPYVEQQVTASNAESIRFFDEFVEPAGLLPNLVAIPAHPPGPPAFPSLFCDSSSPLRYAVTVRNEGSGLAGPSTTEVNRFELGQKMTLETPSLASGEEVTQIFDFGTEVGVNTPFRVTVDAEDVVTEVEENDNTVESECRIEP